MSRAPAGLQRLASLSGIELAYTDAFGRAVEVPVDSLRTLLAAMGVPANSAAQIRTGLRIAEAAVTEPDAEATAPSAWGFEDLGLDRVWGLSVQLYGLTSEHSQGIGDFGTLGALAQTAAGLGAAALGINPLHALFLAQPELKSPYSPSSRRFLNPLYIDLAQVPEHQPDDLEPSQLAAVRGTELVDYTAVAALKLAALERAFARFRDEQQARGSSRAAAFERFCQEQGSALRSYALFEVIQAERRARAKPLDWQDWPAELRAPDSDAVARLAEAEVGRIAFYQYLQWLADHQLGTAQAQAKAAGMALGLYRDFAVGLNPAGADAWANQAVVVPGVTVGAPPDQFNPLGQNWGLAPLSPRGLVAEDERGLRADLRANLRHAGALRIDHVMGLQRLFWIPAGAKPAEGAYVRYPLPDLLRLVAEESRRAKCVVIGEDLGTVPPGFREAMGAAGLLSYRLFYFERVADGAMRPPAAYPREALVAISTHDLPTLAGFWTGRDLDWRTRLDLYNEPAEQAEAEAERARDRARMQAALQAAGLWDQARLPELSHLVPLAHELLATAPSRLMMLQLEDALGELEQANLPGTIDEHPNWRRRAGVPIEALARHAGLVGLAELLAASGRGRARG